MKVAVCCIAKNEDNYIDEWIKYNKKLNFNKIFIYENNWRCSLNYDFIEKINFDGECKQIEAYNHCIKNNIGKYDWIAFFDVDEFLVLKKHKAIQDFIFDYKDYNAIGINWFLYGNNNVKFNNNEYSLIKRFTKREMQVNKHIKSIVKITNDTKMGIHNVVNEQWIDPNKVFHSGPFNKDGPTDIAYINHYFCKTPEEFQNKIDRGRATTVDKSRVRTFDLYDKANCNDVEDLYAYNFFYEKG
jgi:hypothetical protein